MFRWRHRCWQNEKNNFIVEYLECMPRLRKKRRASFDNLDIKKSLMELPNLQLQSLSSLQLPSLQLSSLPILQPSRSREGFRLFQRICWKPDTHLWKSRTEIIGRVRGGVCTYLTATDWQNQLLKITWKGVFQRLAENWHGQALVYLQKRKWGKFPNTRHALGVLWTRMISRYTSLPWNTSEFLCRIWPKQINVQTSIMARCVVGLTR